MIYCSGRLLQAVMAVKLHEDSKTFVDRPMKENRTGQIVINAFNARFPQVHQMIKASSSITKNFRTFHNWTILMSKHLWTSTLISKDRNSMCKQMSHHKLREPAFSCDLPDWNPSPTLLNLINDSKYREFAQDLNAIWIQLCRKVNPMGIKVHFNWVTNYWTIQSSTNQDDSHSSTSHTLLWSQGGVSASFTTGMPTGSSRDFWHRTWRSLPRIWSSISRTSLSSMDSSQMEGGFIISRGQNTCVWKLVKKLRKKKCTLQNFTY